MAISLISPFGRKPTPQQAAGIFGAYAPPKVSKMPEAGDIRVGTQAIGGVTYSVHITPSGETFTGPQIGAPTAGFEAPVSIDPSRISPVERQRIVQARERAQAETRITEEARFAEKDFSARDIELDKAETLETQFESEIREKYGVQSIDAFKDKMSKSQRFTPLAYNKMAADWNEFAKEYGGYVGRAEQLQQSGLAHGQTAEQLGTHYFGEITTLPKPVLIPEAARVAPERPFGPEARQLQAEAERALAPTFAPTTAAGRLAALRREAEVLPARVEPLISEARRLEVVGEAAPYFGEPGFERYKERLQKHVTKAERYTGDVARLEAELKAFEPYTATPERKRLLMETAPWQAVPEAYGWLGGTAVERFVPTGVYTTGIRVPKAVTPAVSLARMATGLPTAEEGKQYEIAFGTKKEIKEKAQALGQIGGEAIYFAAGLKGLKAVSPTFFGLKKPPTVRARTYLLPKGKGVFRFKSIAETKGLFRKTAQRITGITRKETVLKEVAAVKTAARPALPPPSVKYFFQARAKGGYPVTVWGAKAIPKAPVGKRGVSYSVLGEAVTGKPSIKSVFGDIKQFKKILTLRKKPTPVKQIIDVTEIAPKAFRKATTKALVPYTPKELSQLQKFFRAAKFYRAEILPVKGKPTTAYFARVVKGREALTVGITPKTRFIDWAEFIKLPKKPVVPKRLGAEGARLLGMPQYPDIGKFVPGPFIPEAKVPPSIVQFYKKGVYKITAPTLVTVRGKPISYAARIPESYSELAKGLAKPKPISYGREVQIIKPIPVRLGKFTFRAPEVRKEFREFAKAPSRFKAEAIQQKRFGDFVGETPPIFSEYAKGIEKPVLRTGIGEKLFKELKAPAITTGVSVRAVQRRKEFREFAKAPSRFKEAAKAPERFGDFVGPSPPIVAGYGKEIKKPSIRIGTGTKLFKELKAPAITTGVSIRTAQRKAQMVSRASAQAQARAQATAVAQAQARAQATAMAQAVSHATRATSATRMASLTKTRAGQRLVPTEPIPRIPFLRIPPSPVEPKPIPKRAYGFKVLVREAGKRVKGKWRAGRFREVTEFVLPRKAALALGQKEVIGVAKRTFKLIPAFGRLGDIPKLPRFRPEMFIKKGRIFTERTKFAIDTYGEVQQISKKGIAASMAKARLSALTAFKKKRKR